MALLEADIEAVTLEWLHSMGYEVVEGPSIAPGEPAAERDSYGEVVLVGRLSRALGRLNPALPPAALEEAVRKLTRTDGLSLVARQEALHRMIAYGVDVAYRGPTGAIVDTHVDVLGSDASDNEWCAVSQFSVTNGKITRRPDVVLFVNGLPLAVIELKNAANAAAGPREAFQQLQTYKAQIPNLLAYTAVLVASDGVRARVGSISADWERFQPWRTIDGDGEAPSTALELEVMLRGAFAPERFCRLYRHYVVFEDDGAQTIAKIAGYHQYHAVEVAVAETRRAAGVGVGRSADGRRRGDQRVGVIWHTQGSGKSLTMAFYAGRVALDHDMENPTIVVLTDRNDLDNQLFGTFTRCRALLRQVPVQADSRADLRDKLAVSSGGVVFTTIQKFLPEEKGDRHPLLSDRRNVVVIADEAHRSQYDFIDGFARHLRDALPNASFIGFTGTPIEAADANTPAVFGEYISVYDIEQAVADGATVPIYYESRLAKLELRPDQQAVIDAQFEEATEGEEVSKREQLKSKWAALEAIVGADDRIKLIAQDLVSHFEARQEVLAGKGMIVGMSRRVCVALYDAIVALRPEWHDEDARAGQIKIIMTGSASDPLPWQQHIRAKSARDALAERFRDPADPFKLVIVRDMWLTGFDAPCLHTMYVDKPMRGHGLMQAIARVNRVFKDKPGGLIVDYLGLADQLREALATYTAGSGRGRPTVDKEEAVAVLRKYHEICSALFHGFDWSAWTGPSPAARLALLPPAQEHILGLENGKQRLAENVGQLRRAFALAVPHDGALAIRDDVEFFQTVNAVLSKQETRAGKSSGELDQAIRQIVSSAISGEGIVDVFAAAGLARPDVSILSEDFLAQVKGMRHRNLAVEVLAKLLKGEIKVRGTRNVVKSRAFSELLDQSLRRYQNRAIETAQVIEELIELARQMREAEARGEQLGLSHDEVAFYDALETSDSAVAILGDDILREIARELTKSVKANVSVDWAIRDTVRAQLRVLVKRILRKYGYPPNKAERATDVVLQQAEVLSGEWAAAG